MSEPGFARLAASVVARYAGSGRAARRYVAGKLRHDPVTEAILAEAASENLGEVADLGCGRGQLGIALLLAGAARAVRGFERAEGARADALRAGAGLAFVAEARDLAVDPVLPPVDTVLIVDVLYQLAPPAQAALLAAAARAARGRVLIRALDPERGLRSAATIALERAMRRLWPHSGAHVAPCPLAEIIAPLRAAGFAVTVAPCWRGTPFANVLISARRQAPPPG
ncbi:MAG: hypothetical protein KGI51_11285 [Rhodospirillales bacterium]|nr:hypothetical protein [Rhodospirillales bacterium]